jgi:hypothetical protein
MPIWVERPFVFVALIIRHWRRVDLPLEDPADRPHDQVEYRVGSAHPLTPFFPTVYKKRALFFPRKSEFPTNLPPGVLVLSAVNGQAARFQNWRHPQNCHFNQLHIVNHQQHLVSPFHRLIYHL